MRIIYNIFNILRFNRRNWKAVVLCIFTATVFWFFNALNKTYTTNISFPLSFDYDDDNFLPVGNLPANVRLNVTGNGWELFKRSTGVKLDPLQIPLERPGDVKKIVGSGLKFSFTNQLNGSTSARTLRGLYDQRCLTAILEFISVLNNLSFSDRSEIVINSFKLELR